jgi:G3E family GTPase
LAASLVAGIKDFRRNLSPDYLFIEPSELVLTAEMHNVTLMGLRDIAYDIGPFITLVEGPSFQLMWQERQLLLLGQIAGADLVAVSKSDLITAGMMADIVNTLKAHRNGVLQLSARSGLGLKEVVETIGGAS